MKIKALLYCCRNNKKLLIKKGNEYIYDKWLLDGEQALNGKIACECEVETEEIELLSCLVDSVMNGKNGEINIDDFLKHSCLNFSQLEKYLKYVAKDKDMSTQVGYALHLSNIKVFDKPRELSLYSSSSEEYRPIKKAPQNMCNAYYDEGTKHYILISIRPQWLCKILNGEKTIEVRRRVLKGMCD